MSKGFGEKKAKRIPTIKELKGLSLDRQKEISHAVQHKASNITVQSRVNSRDKQPMVDIQWGKQRAEFTPPEAFRHALGIIEAAIAAETDAALFELGTRVVGVEPEVAACLLLEFRKFREENPKRFAAWRGHALNLLTAAESTESDEFLRNFLERIGFEDKEESERIIEEFQQLRELRRNRIKLIDL